ncbi:hypothetical protein C1645_811635 [Glomus cerebriforme]|uniref:Uncharacterized protein n=1 Tax=Glomus cerebriforme TaxID=658196 RepID=A0A397TW44_9GLOM|nr:hypothetical protein C1645_811635 [Glomus cerebriforme]
MDSSKVGQEKFEISNKNYYSNATKQEAEVEEQTCNRNEIENYEDISKLSRFCTNGERIKEMQISIGELRRVCVLGDVKWTEKELRTKACNYVLAMHRYRNNISKKSIYIMPEASKQVESKGLSGSLSMVVDTFVDESIRHNLASSIWCDLPTNSSDPKKLGYYYECVAEFGFNHIIVIGEMLYGLLFIDCYGRVFQWENMEQVLWPVGNSLEDVKSHEDLVVWTVEDDIVYEDSRDSLKPRKPSSVKSTKNNRLKKKKKK